METEGIGVGSANNEGGIATVATPLEPAQAARSQKSTKCAVCRRDHKKCVRTGDDEKCVRCQANNYDCFGGPSVLSAPKQVLNFEKCEFCRKAKQKCLPPNRAWPESCDRCTEKGLPCSAPINSRKRQRVESVTSLADENRPTQNLQSASPPSARRTPQAAPLDSANQQPQVINNTLGIESNTTMGPVGSALDSLSQTGAVDQQGNILPSLMDTHDQDTISRLRKEKAQERWDRVLQDFRKRIKIRKIAIGFVQAPSRGVLCRLCVILGLSRKSFVVQSNARQSMLQREPATLKDRLWPMSKSAKTLGEFPLGDIPFGDGATIRKRGLMCAFCHLVWKSAEDQIPRVGKYNKLQVPQSSYGVFDELEAYVTWQNDGREFLVSGSTRPRSRRIRIRWSREGSRVARDSGIFLNDAFIVPFGDQHRLWDSNFLGRRIDFNDNVAMQVKNWDDQCQRRHSHNETTAKKELDLNSLGLHNFRLIDVVQMRTVSPEHTKIPQYVALSYTWAGQRNIFFRREDFKEFEALGSKMGVQKRWSDIPRTIQDAITLVQELGYRYLWVDVLCTIFEDSPVDHYAMGQIFSQAFLTICAADGNGPDAGLVAFNPSRNPPLQHLKECVPELHLMVSHPAQTWINKSMWNSRGWTFQERMLSGRCLIFVAGRVYWECRSGTRSQDIIEDSREPTWSLNMLSNPLKYFENLQDKSQAIRAYMCSVEEYSPRRLSFARDRLLAFENVGNLIGNSLDTGLLCGLLSSHLDFALLWEFKEAPSTLEICHTETNVLPSWSWVGWDTPTVYRHSSLVGVLSDPQTWIKTRTWISWYVRDRYNITRSISKYGDRATNTAPPEVVLKLESPVVKFKEEHLRTVETTVSSPQGARKTPLQNIITKANVKFPEYNRSTFFKTVPNFQSEVMDIDSDVPENMATRDTKYLQFWTWSGFFRLYDIPLPKSLDLGRGLSRCGILDDKDDFCGTIILPDKWVENNFAKEDGIDAVYEFVAISEAKNFTEEELSVWTYYIPKEREESEWDLWYVLLVEKIDDVVVRRMGLGKVFKAAFENSCAPGKEWREFIMA